MAGPSTSAQRLWQSLKSQFRANPCSVGAASLLTASAVIGLSFLTGGPADHERKGLQRLASTLQLFQAFRADASQPPPLLWKRRLGVKPAEQIWQRLGRGIWWQGWSVDGQAYLVLPSNLLTSEEQNRGVAHDIDGFVVFSADALNRQHLRDKLASTEGSAVVLSPLLSSCLKRLSEGPAVVWRPEALARFGGASAPLLQSAGYGCLSLRVNSGHLQWQGWVGSRDLGAAPPKLKPRDKGFPDANQKSAVSSAQSSALLMLEGDQLGLLLSALANREIIREPLEQNYALGAVERKKLLQAPFRLRLLPQPKGEFKAGLQLQLWPQTDRKGIDRSLKALRGRLTDQGLIATGGDGVIWRESGGLDQVVVGGWRWLQPQSSRPVISLGLGISPSPQPLPRWGEASKQAEVLLELQARPADLVSRGLLDGQWPKVVRTAPTLSLRMLKLGSARESFSWTEFSGQLELSAAEES